MGGGPSGPEPLLNNDRAEIPDDIHDPQFEAQSLRDKVRVFHDKFIMSNGMFTSSQTLGIFVYYVLIAVVTWLLPLYFILKPTGDTWTEKVDIIFMPANMKKFIVFNVLHGVIGLGAMNGPLGGHFMIPIFEPLLVFLTPGSLCSPLVPSLVGCVLKTPGKRSFLAVLAFIAYLVTLVLALIAPSVTFQKVLPIYITLAVCCVFDFSIFFASRGEHYFYMMICMAFPDWIHGCQCVQFMVWFGAGMSKVGPWFRWVILMLPRDTMWSLCTPKGVTAKMLSKNAPEDTSPSSFTLILSYLGALGELFFPICCLFPPGGWANVVGVYGMICYHAFIISTLPTASVFEWQYYCMVMTYFLYGKNHVSIPSSPGLLAFLFVVLIIFPIAGQLDGKLVPFLMGYRQYAGNWRQQHILVKRSARHKLNKIKTWTSPIFAEQIPMADGEQLVLDFLALLITAPQFRGMFSIWEAWELNSSQSMADYDFTTGSAFNSACMGNEMGVGWLHFRECWRHAILDICGFEPTEFMTLQIEPVSSFPPYISAYRLMDIAKGPMDADVYAEVPYQELEGPTAPDTWVKQERIQTRCKSIKGTLFDTYY